MNACIWRGTCLAIALAATTGLAAQGGSPAAQGATDITLSGCIQKADPPAGGGSAGFLVSNVTSVTVPSNYPEGAITRIYRLDADAAKISPHVGHQVTITGTLTARPSSGPAPPPGKPTTPPTAANAPTLKVTSVSMVSATCS